MFIFLPWPTFQGDAWARHLARRRSSHVFFFPWTYWFQSMGVPIGKMMINIDKAPNFGEPLYYFGKDPEVTWAGNLCLIGRFDILSVPWKKTVLFVKPQCRAQFVKTNSSPLFEVVKTYWLLLSSNIALKPRKKGNTQHHTTMRNKNINMGRSYCIDKLALSSCLFLACNSDRHWDKKGVRQWRKGLPPQPWKR